MSKQRKFRVSVFPPGTTDLGSTPLHHHACQSQRSAEEHFLKYVARKDAPRVIVHQGNLRGTAYKTILDSSWFEHYEIGDKRHKGAMDFIENRREKRGENSCPF
jgi:hypothetical protein